MKLFILLSKKIPQFLPQSPLISIRVAPVIQSIIPHSHIQAITESCHFHLKSISQISHFQRYRPRPGTHYLSLLIPHCLLFISYRRTFPYSWNALSWFCVQSSPSHPLCLRVNTTSSERSHLPTAPRVRFLPLKHTLSLFPLWLLPPTVISLCVCLSPLEVHENECSVLFTAESSNSSVPAHTAGTQYLCNKWMNKYFPLSDECLGWEKIFGP